ncbi:M1 family metallopeptidase [Chitinophaga barathri]|uniref:Aminopeptidase N n=1 Tax=Chitinophaga barathri TaxID=1647451 RepID=A0A3N4MEG5_9BACT|nr:M1 family metallopeptidase [Chitinophaga barathri]RPD38109.1 M1 family peptidase [Chitinophaga barathri]
MKYATLAGILLAAAACQTPAPKQEADTTPVKDLHTLSNADSIHIRNLDLNIEVDFSQKQIRGIAGWHVANPQDIAVLKLDTYGLSIDSVTVNGQKVQHTLDAAVPNLGSRLNIPVDKQADLVQIWYKTSPEATALQWLEPSQTMGKKQPFLYTQSESIYARTWIPCPDGPGIRFPYTARVKVPKDLMALMSAVNVQQRNDSGIYTFSMEQPVPAYLMALAVGDISFKAVDSITGVYTEPAMLDKAAWELADIGKMVTTAGQLYGPYRWGRYDVLVLPPGFPLGGMENPRLTFATPTIIAGDRSLVSLIAHELAHSWSGNLVTNATWEDFWLNEGFTVYFERRIMEAMQGEDYSDMLWELGYQDLQGTVEELGKDSKDTWLKLDLRNRNPDDGLTDIAYEKGAHFLRLIEKTAGRAKLDTFLRTYFDSHAFKTMNTAQFLQYLDANLIKGDTAMAGKIRINDWVYGPGIPDNCPRAPQKRFTKVSEEVKRFQGSTAAKELQTTGWSSHEWLYFLRALSGISKEKMKELDATFRFTQTGNSEMADQWFVMAVAADYEPAYPAMEKFLSEVGRRKFLTPLYTEMMKTPKGKEMAIRIYGKYKQNYHPLAQETLNKLVKG